MQESQNQPSTAPKEEPMLNTKDKISKKQIVFMAILSIIAIAGVAFGIFGIADSSNKNQEIERLKAQIKEGQNQEAKSETNETIIPDSNNATTEIAESADKTNKYIYLSDWGIKIKINNNLEAFNIFHSNAEINGVETDQYTLETVFAENFKSLSNGYYKIASYPKNYIIRSKEAVLELAGNRLNAIYNDGEYNYFTHPSTGHAYEDPDETVFSDSERNGFNNAYFETTEILKNSENYSKI